MENPLYRNGKTPAQIQAEIEEKDRKKLQYDLQREREREQARSNAAGVRLAKEEQRARYYETLAEQRKQFASQRARIEAAKKSAGPSKRKKLLGATLSILKELKKETEGTPRRRRKCKSKSRKTGRRKTSKKVHKRITKKDRQEIRRLRTLLKKLER